ncbi:MAG TPA: GNAT family N-acetyltransferase [Chloroflexota bacterium]|nr:GNAT family N-acetyltransferase [Chloroflexota bacterium]
MAENFEIEPLGNHHGRAAFSCGEPVLDHYLQARAGQEQRRKVAAVFILNETITATVAGFYRLSMYAVRPTELPEAFRRKQPNYDQLPAVLIGRLAVDSRFERRGLGARLLMDALARSYAATQQVAAVGVVVEAKNDRMRTWYESFGFESFPDSPNRLFLAMATINKLITKI